MQLENTERIQTEKSVETAKKMKKAGLFFFLLILFEFPVSFLIGVIQLNFPEEYATLISILCTQGYLLISALIYIAVTKTKLQQDLQIKKYKVSTFFLSLLVLITASPMATLLNLVSQLFAENTTSGAIFSVTGNVPMWLGVIIIGCLPGFIEELIYRGILFSAFRKRSVLTGIVVSALAFGLMHFNFNQIMYAIYLGLVFALIVEATGSLVSTMFLHMSFNAINTAYVYALPKFYALMSQYSEEYQNIDLEAEFAKTPTAQSLLPMIVVVIPFAIGGLIIAFLLIKQMAKINQRELNWKFIVGNKEEVKQIKPVNGFLIAGCVICLLIATLNLLA